jgi:polysaccharide biosynthesis transport protein
MPNPSVEPEEEGGHPGLSLPSIFRSIWKRKVRIAAVWIVLTVAALAIVRMLPAVYLAEAVVLIDSQKIPEKFVSATVATDLEDRIAAIRQMLLSSGELKKIIDDFDLYRGKRKNHVEEEILDMMRRDITITLQPVGDGSSSRDKRTGAFRIGYQGPEPMIVMRVANRLTDLYVESNLKTRESQAAGTSDFLDTQLREAKKRLDELEASVSSYKLQHNGELPQQEASLGATLARLQTELETNRDAINRVQQTRVILEGNLSAMETTLAAQVRAWEQTQQAVAAGAPVPLPDQPNAVPQRKASEVMQDQLAVLRGRYSDDHPDVMRMRADLEKVKRVEEQRESAKAAAPPETAPKTPALPGDGTARERSAAAREPVEFARTREQIATLKAQIKASDRELEARTADQKRILRDLDTYQRRIERLPVREQEMAQLTRDYEMSKENYKSLLDKRMAAGIALNMERQQQSERFTVLDRAQVPERPIKPKRQMLYAAGCGAALALALLMGIVVELQHNVLLGEWELPPGTPVLARLPYIEVSVPSAPARPQGWRRWFARKQVTAAGCEHV